MRLNTHPQLGGTGLHCLGAESSNTATDGSNIDDEIGTSADSIAKRALASGRV